VAGSEALAIIAEVSIGLAGFTGVVVVFGRVQLDALLSLRLLLAILPFVLSELPIAADAVWLIGNSLLAGYGVTVLSIATPSVRRLRVGYPQIFRSPAIAMSYGLLSLSSLSGVVGLMAPSARVGGYLAGLFLLLCQGAFQFVRILFTHPAGNAA